MQRNQLVCRQIRFAHHDVLTAQMLERLQSYPREVLAHTYSDWGDGIICGLEYIEEKAGRLYLNPGMVKWAGKFYFLHERVNISDAMGQQEVEKKNAVIHMHLVEGASRNEKSNIEETLLEIRFSLEQQAGVLHLCSFKPVNIDAITLPVLSLQEKDRNIGGQKQIGPFWKFFRHPNLLLAEVPYACKGGTTFHPCIFSAVREFLSVKENKTMLDYAMLVHLQASGTLPMATVKHYIREYRQKDTKIHPPANRAELLEQFFATLVQSKFILPSAVGHAPAKQETQAPNPKQPRSKMLPWQPVH